MIFASKAACGSQSGRIIQVNQNLSIFQSCCQISSTLFLDSHPFSYTHKNTFICGYALYLFRCVPGKEVGILVLAGLAPSSQIVGPLLRTSWLSKPEGKMIALN